MRGRTVHTRSACVLLSQSQIAPLHLLKQRNAVSKRDGDKKKGRPIDRRDFLNGVALTIGSSLLPFERLLGQDPGPDPSAQEYFLSKGITPQDPRYYPPALTGMRGSHPGSFE